MPDAKKYDWYEVVSSDTPLEQGDFIDNFPIINPDIASVVAKKEHSTDEQGRMTDIAGDQKIVNVIVMTQTCDIEDFRDEDHILLCPRYLGKEIVTTHVNPPSFWGDLKKDRTLGAHLLNSSPDINGGFDYQIVVLKMVYSYPLKFVKEFVKQAPPRVRLLPPYREHLSQAFARQFMRVGLPVDLSKASYPYTQTQSTLPTASGVVTTEPQQSHG